MLPIQHILSDLIVQLTKNDAIVVAPPGAGKSTALPLALLKADIFDSKKIIMLQPRRVAARNIAFYLAKQLDEQVGHSIGYRIKGESKVSANTRLEIVTEGVLTRMLQDQPELPDVGLVIFDEFHERSIHADFSLALCLEVQQALRDDLRLLVMSATLNVQAVQSLMPSAKVLTSEGKSYPVDIVYRANESALPLAEKVTRLIRDVFVQHQGDCLVFLPGVADIMKAADGLQKAFNQEVAIHPLYSELAKAEQDNALQVNPDGKRKIILATNIAETSLTIEGIELVVDSGIEKNAIFHLNRGVTHLQSQKISQASAVQRAGRAGRLKPGTCYRLWSKEQHDRLNAQSPAEILQSDMSSFMLETAIWGSDIEQLSLIDYPSTAQVAQGAEYLSQLSLFDSDQHLTLLGRQAHKLGTHPAIAVMLIQSQQLGANHHSLACALACLFENKDPLPKHLARSYGAEVSARLHFLLQQKNHPMWQSIRQWHKKVNAKLMDWPFDDLAVLIAFAYPNWLAKQRNSETYQLLNGAGAILYSGDALLEKKWLAVAKMQTSDRQSDNSLIRYAEPISLSQIKQYFAELITSQDVLEWDDDKQKIVAHTAERLGKIVLQKQPNSKPSTDKIMQIWRQVIHKKGISLLPFSEHDWQLIYRLRLAKECQLAADFPDFSDAGLLENIDTWLLPYLTDKVSWVQLAQCQFVQQLTSLVDYSVQQRLNTLLPESLKLPTGRNARLTFDEQGKVTLAVRMQELYGLQQHPQINNGQIAITLELLSPAQRPLQTTQDLPGFWAGSYKQVQKEMKGRYPRHFWPDDPANAPATTTTKKRMNNE